MLNDSGAPAQMWGEALYVATYVTNRSPTSSLTEAKTPYEMWFGSVPRVRNLRVFGCVSYAHIVKERRTKLDKKSELLGFVGYAPNGYRLWNSAKRTVIVSRDVVFDESKSFFNGCGQTEANHFEDNVADLPIVEIIETRDQTEVNLNEDNDEASVISSENFEQATSDIDSENDRDENVLHRSQRNTRAPRWLDEYETSFTATDSINNVPQDIKELKKRDDWPKWRDAIKEELQSLSENNTWTLVGSVPEGRKAINSMWVFMIKMNDNSYRYKARLVAKGCSQRPGMDFCETFSPVAKMTSVRTLLAIAVQKKWIIHQMDLKTAFLNGFLDETIYMRLPNLDDEGSKICKLNRSIYGLKQAGRSWNIRFDETMKEMNFRRLNSDSCVYVSKNGKIIIILYVDDILIFGEELEEVRWVKNELSKHFKMKDLNEVSNFLGLDIHFDAAVGRMTLSQESYIDKVLRRFSMSDCNPVSIPMDPNIKWKKSGNRTKEPFKELLGCLQYLALISRPDITVSVSILSQFQSEPGEEHWTGLKRILRYLRMIYERSNESAPLTGFADADFANDEEGRKSNSGCLFMVYGNVVSWSSKRQQVVTLSSTEAELVSLCNASKEGVWLSKLLSEIGIHSIPFTIFEDNIPCIRIAEEPREHQRTKHVDVKFMYVREQIKEKKLIVKYVPTVDQIADYFTKPLARAKFDKFTKELNMKIEGKC